MSIENDSVNSSKNNKNRAEMISSKTSSLVAYPDSSVIQDQQAEVRDRSCNECE